MLKWALEYSQLEGHLLKSVPCFEFQVPSLVVFSLNFVFFNGLSIAFLQVWRLTVFQFFSTGVKNLETAALA